MIVGALIGYIILQVLMGIFMFLACLTIRYEAADQEWKRVILAFLMLFLVIIGNFMIVDIFFFDSQMIDYMIAWLVSEL